MELKESLVIIHASDYWMNSQIKNCRDSFLLKTSINARIKKYLKMGKPVFYTPYMKSEDAVPRYFAHREMVEQIDFIEGMRIPSMLSVKFQAIILKNVLLRDNLNSVEIGGVMHSACVAGTHRGLTLMNANDVQTFNEMQTEDVSLRKDILSRFIVSEINYDITDRIFEASR